MRHYLGRFIRCHLWEIPYDEIIMGDLSLIDRKISGVANDMRRQFMDMLYTSLSAATERSGNVVDAKKIGSIPASFLEMLKKVEFSVGRDGKVNLPEKITFAPKPGRDCFPNLMHSRQNLLKKSNV